ncbi:MAG: Ig-like domain-containing protein [Pirellulales bacterium]
MTPTLAGAAPNFVVTFFDDGNGLVDNNLQLQINAGTNELEWAVNGGAFSNDLDPAAGTQSATFADIADIFVQLGQGNDALSWNLQTFAFDATISPDTGNPLNTSILLVDTGSAESVQVTANGTELFLFQGAGDNDELEVDPGAGDHQLRVDGYDGLRDRVVSDSIPETRFDSLNTFTIDPISLGTDVVTFATLNLTGALNYQTNLGAFDTLVIEGADGSTDLFSIENVAGQTVVTHNGAPRVVTNISTDLGALRINGLGGDDRVTVDVDATGLIGTPIFFDGGTGNDLLTVSGTPIVAVDESIYTPGPALGSGQLSYEGVADTLLMSIGFANLAPVVDLVPAASLTVNGNAADNAINYAQGSLAPRGLVTIDDHESIEFANKTSLVINAGAGSDTINLNNPTTPTGLTGIAVNGGDPTASDALIVNGTAAANTIVYTPQAVGQGTVAVTGLPTVSFATTEHLIVNGLGGSDTLSVDSAAINGTQVFTPGTSNDSGTLDFQDNTLANFIATTLSFLGLGSGGKLTSADGAPGGPRVDSFIYRGTDLLNNFSLQGLNASTGTINVDSRIPVEVSDMNEVTLAGLGGDDTFTLLAGAGGLPFDGVTIDGGEPSASDIANLSGATGGVTLVLGDPVLNTNTAVVGYGAPVRFLAVEVVNLNTNGNSLTVTGTPSSDQIDYTPTGPEAGTFAPADVNTVFNFTNTTGALTVDPAAGSDSVVINGTSSSDAITVSQSGGTVSVAIAGFKTVQMPAANVQALIIAGGFGNDTLTIDSTAGPVLVPVTYDGEHGSDTLQLLGGTALSDTYSVGPEVGSGTSTIVFAGGTQTVHFQNLEPVIDLVAAATLTVDGTAADNAINYSQGSLATRGLVSVDNFESIEFANKTSLVINAGAGSDTINLNNPSTPTGLTGITVNGGDPTASDTLIVNGIAGSVDELRLNPTGAGAGNVVNDSGLQPVVNFTLIEHLELVVQQADGDGVRIEGTTGNDRFEFFPGATSDRGTFRGTMDQNNATGVGPFALTETSFRGVNVVSNDIDVNFFNPGGTDTLIFNGTASNDLIAVLAGGGGGTELRNTINGAIVSRLELFSTASAVLRGGDGDDTFNIAGGLLLSLQVEGGDPSASDVVNLSGAVAAIVVTLADDTIGIPTTVQGYGANVTLSGVEIANLSANGNALTALGSTNDDVIVYTPTGSDTGTFAANSLNTQFNFSSVTGAFTVDGGAGDSADELIVRGSNTRDTFQINQGARTVQVLTNNVTALKTVTLASTMETLTAEGLAGQDTFQVIPAAGIGAFPLDNLLINVEGGTGSNALVVASTFAGAALPGNNFVVVNRDATPSSGTVRVYQNAVANPDINYQSVQVVSPHVSGTDVAPNLLVMGPDENEPNESQGTAAFLGSGATIEVEHAAIFPNSAEFPSVPADIDFYRIVAAVTGTLDLSIFFRTIAPGLLPGNGVLTLEVRDNLGNVVATGAANADGLRSVFPVIAGKSYYARVAGADGTVVNGYSLLAENFAAPVPTAVVLDPLDDSGSSNLDNVTFETTGVHFLVHADLNLLATEGITILTPAQAAAGLTPGAAVEVFVNGVSAGFATLVAGSGNTLFEIALSADLTQFSAGGPNAAGVLGYPGFTNLIAAAVRIFDVQRDGGGALDPDTARAGQSVPEQVLFDNIDPLAPIDFALLASSDSGALGDGITSVNPPAFGGRGEANTFVRIFVDGALVGEGRVGSDATDGVLGDGLGIWEVTVEPLADGTYTFTAQLEDLAGNLSEASIELEITIDSVTPQRPTIDLLNNYDTGSFNLDNVTYFTELQFRVSAEPGSTVVIKDGNTIIDAFVMPAADFTIRTISWPVVGIAAEGPHPLSAEVTDAAGNRSAQSEELLLEIDTIPPAPPSTPQLLDASDSGVPGDGITSVNPPAFKGTGEANAIVRIFALKVGEEGAVPELVGEGRVGSDLTDPPEDLPDEPPIGAWEVTIEPLADGQYEIFAVLEDLAGNISEPSESLLLEIDTLAPQRPTLDLVDAFDTGWSDKDNVTYLTTLDFRVSAEPGTNVVIKDGNTVIDMFVMPAVTFTIRTLDFVILEGINGIPANGPHPLSAEATDAADNRSAQSEELLVTIDSTAPAAPTTPDLLASSDSGTFDNDNVTNIQAAAFQGTGESNSRVRIFANGVQVGEGIVGTDLTDPPAQLPGDPPAFGHWEVTVEPLDSGTYIITAEIEDQAGNITLQETSLTVHVDTVLPNTPYLDLTQASDSGRNNQDNITNDNTPTVTSTIDDVQGAATNAFPHDIRYRIYDRPGTGPDVLLVDSFVSIPGFSTNKFFTDVLPLLADGVHNLKLEAEDRAGNVNDFLLQITIDTVAPPVFFGLAAVATDGLDPDSDSGVEGVPDTFVDRITNVTRPTFWGSAEANSLVRLFNTDFGGAVIFGQDQAIPLDGNFAFPDGRWSISTTIDLNDPAFFSFDGFRQMAITAEDVAGNESDLQLLDIFIDTQGPQVTDVFITDHGDFNLFGLKPNNASQGPTPLVYSLTINLQDLPFQDAAFLRDAIEAGVAATPGLITLRGDHNGFISIDDIQVILDAPVANTPATASIVLSFNSALPDDRYTLVIDDALVDIAGNNLDGENNAVEPSDSPNFPTGDGQPGGDFEARFTVDSRPEVGAYAAASIYIDINGNLIYDPQGSTGDTTNRDLTFGLGIVPSLQGVVSPFNVHDGLFAGNFSGLLRNGENGAAGAFADGYDKLAAYGFDNAIGKFRWLIDTNHDGVIDPAAGDHATIQGAGFQINGLPVAGNFDGDATNGDEIGLFDGTKWYFDTNRNWVIDGGDQTYTLGLRGTPIVGDFNGDGIEDLGTWRTDQFTFNFGTQPGGAGTQPNWSGGVQATINWGLPGTADKPVAADMDGDGITDIGLYLPERTGVLPLEGGHWEFLISNDFDEQLRGGNQVTALNHPFSPTPLGFDIFSQFGDSFALPIVGNFDPPVAPPQTPDPTALPAVFGSVPMGTQTISGEQWYSFTSVRDGVIAVDATSTTPGALVTAGLYDTDFRLLSAGGLTATGKTSMHGVIEAGQTYLLRLSGNATASITMSNQVPDHDRLDTSRDGLVSPLDALRVINELIRSGTQVTPLASTNSKMYLDTNLDGHITPLDALQVFNYLARQSAAAAATPSAEPAVASPAAAMAAVASEDVATMAVEPSTPLGNASLAFALSLEATPSAAEGVGSAPAVDAFYAELEADSTLTWDDDADEPLIAEPVSVGGGLDDGDEAPTTGDVEWDWLG